MSKSLKITADHVMVMPANPPKSTKGGILLPMSMQEEQHREAFYGRVIAVGSKVEEVQVTEIVLFDRHESNPLVIPGKVEVLMVFVREDAILARFSKEAALEWELDYPSTKKIRRLAELTYEPVAV